MSNSWSECTIILLKQLVNKQCIAMIITIVAGSSTSIAQYCSEFDNAKSLENRPILSDAPVIDKPAREDTYSIGFMPGRTHSLESAIFSYSIFSTFKFHRKNKGYGFWFAGSVDRSFHESNERFLSYNPKSDTSFVTHWDIALFALHFGWDWNLTITDRANFYFRLGLNVGRYIHRNRTVKYFDYSQDGKQISETLTKIEQPIGATNYGFLLGFGLEYRVKPKHLVAITPTFYIRGGGYYGFSFSTLGVSLAYSFGIGRTEKH